MCQTNDKRDIENGDRNSDIKANMPKNLSFTKKRGIYMDEALSKTKFGIFNFIVIFLSGLILNAVLMETCGISFVLPVSECDLDLTAGEKGVLNAVGFFGIICSSHLWGFLADTKGRRSIIQPTLFVAFLLSCAASLVENFYIFVTLRFFNGFFISGSAATVYAYLSEFHDNKYRAKAIMQSAIIYGISCLLLPIIAVVVINQDWKFDIPYIAITFKPWRMFIIVCALPGLISAIILMFLPESPKFVLGQGDKAGAYEILQKMYRINEGRKAVLEDFEIFEEPESIANRQRILKAKESRFPLFELICIQTAPLFRAPYLCSTILICTIQFGIYATSNGFYMLVPEILNQISSTVTSFTEQRFEMCAIIRNQTSDTKNFTAPDTGSANVTAVKKCVTKFEIATIEQELILEGIYAVGFMIIGLLINVVGKFPILFSLLSVCGAGGIACMFLQMPLLQVCSFIAFMSCGMAVNIVNAATVDLYPTSSRAMAVSISLMFGRLGCVLGANVSALFIESHCEIVFYAFGSSLIMMAILTYFIPNIHKKVKQTETTAPMKQRLSVVSLQTFGSFTT